MDGKPAHVPDVQADAEYNFGQAPVLGEYRAVLAVPLMRDGAVEGVLLLDGRRPGRSASARSNWSRPLPTRP